MKKKVLVFGTFDGLHEGHLDFFRQARKFGDYLCAVVGRDSTVYRVKEKYPMQGEKERLKAVQECGLVDEAVLGKENNLAGEHLVDNAMLGNKNMSPYIIVAEINPDVICLGYDQGGFADKLPEKLKEMGLDIPIHRLKAYLPEKFKSSILNKQ